MPLIGEGLRGRGAAERKGSTRTLFLQELGEKKGRRVRTFDRMATSGSESDISGAIAASKPSDVEESGVNTARPARLAYAALSFRCGCGRIMNCDVSSNAGFGGRPLLDLAISRDTPYLVFRCVEGKGGRMVLRITRWSRLK